MTWSIVARDRSGAFGVAIASRFFAVGVLCPHARSGVGALATQALVNPLYGARALELMAQGVAPAEVVNALIAADAGREHRQLHMIDAPGRIAAHTGSACIDWCGQLAGEGYSVAGNMLAGPQVIRDTAAAYEAGADLPFAERLIAALEAGDAAGGDKRGKQAAALLIHGAEDYPLLEPARGRPRQSAGGTAPAVGQEPRALPAVRCLPAGARASRGHHRPHADRSRDRALHRRAHKKAAT